MAQWEKEIFKQKSLTDIYLASTVISKSKFNTYLLASYSIILIILLTVNFITEGVFLNALDAANIIKAWAKIGTNLAVSILGFLIAGFAIFASVTKPELFIALAKIPYKVKEEKTGLNRLQFIFFNFFNIFISYLGLLILSVVIEIFSVEGSPIIKLSYKIYETHNELSLFLVSFLLFIFSTWFVSALIRLKSFIWNLYQAVLFTIVASDLINQ